MKLAQGILCGNWALAFSFEWASQIVDRFELTPIPKAPAWLLGAANVDGNIVPVVDLTAYLNNDIPVSNSQQRLLIGGLSIHQSGADSTGDAIAIAFEGLPQQLRYEPSPLTYASSLPERLREICVGVGSNAARQEFLEIDAARLVDILSEGLAQA